MGIGPDDAHCHVDLVRAGPGQHIGEAEHRNDLRPLTFYFYFDFDGTTTTNQAACP